MQTTTVPSTKAGNPSATSNPSRTKVQVVVDLMRRKRGATIDELAKATGWQHHSIRGLISGTIKKKLLLNVEVEKGNKSGSCYRIVTAKAAK